MEYSTAIINNFVEEYLLKQKNLYNVKEQVMKQYVYNFSEKNVHTCLEKVPVHRNINIIFELWK